MPQPIIGITAPRIRDDAGARMTALKEAYSLAIARAGGLPVIIPVGLEDEVLLALFRRLDGVLFSGGGDVDTSRYHGLDHPSVNGVDLDRDRSEVYLVKQVAQGGLPFLGICRGIQMINVALGGTLYSHIADQHPGALKHDYYPDYPRDYVAHEVSIEVGSRLAGILGTAHVSTNSLHHQGIQQPAPGLRVLAHAPDGIVEAVEYEGHPFGLAVQWHPECMPDSPPMQALFRAFVAAASQDKAAR